MTELETPKGDPGCEICSGAGYQVSAVGALAQASICSCVLACAACNGTGQRHLVMGDRVRVGRCRCQMLPDRVALFNRAGVPARHADSTFTSFQPHQNRLPYRACQNWVKEYRPGEENRGLVLWGKVGRGKTHLVVAALRTLILDKGVECRFVEFSHLLSQLKAGYDSGMGEATTIAALVRVPVLAIDELGKGRGSEWEKGIIDQLVSHRYNALATILATTNFPVRQATGLSEANLAKVEQNQTLGDRVGDRVLSRIKEMVQAIPVGGDDFRQKSRL